MKKLVAAAILTACFAVPAAAQDTGLPTFTEEEVAAATAAIADLGLDDATYRDLWCGAAFVGLNRYLETQGETEGATQALDMSNLLFARVETALAPQAYTQEQLSTIGANASIVAIAQLGAGPEGEVEFSQEECTAAAQAE